MLRLTVSLLISSICSIQNKGRPLFYFHITMPFTHHPLLLIDAIPAQVGIKPYFHMGYGSNYAYLEVDPRMTSFCCCRHTKEATLQYYVAWCYFTTNPCQQRPARLRPSSALAICLARKPVLPRLPPTTKQQAPNYFLPFFFVLLASIFDECATSNRATRSWEGLQAGYISDPLFVGSRLMLFVSSCYLRNVSPNSKQM